jgi:hypothetical protein
VTFHEDVRLDDVDRRLQGVVVTAPAPALVGESGGVAALLHAPPLEAPVDEARRFVRSLIDQDQVDFDPTTPTDARRTHAVEQRNDRSELRRVRIS